MQPAARTQRMTRATRLKTILAATTGALALLAIQSPAPAAAQTALTMYYPVAVGGPLTELVDSLVAEFEAEHPEITVEAIYSGNYDDTRVRAISAMEAGNAPQLSVLAALDLYEMVEQGAVVAFDDLIESDEDRAWLTSFYPGLLENSLLDGKTYGVPFQRSTIVLYWNKEMFEAAGLDPETPPATWDEMVEMGQQIAAHYREQGEDRYGVMIPSTGYPYWMFQGLAMQNDLRLMNEDGTEVYFDDPAAVEALEYWASLSQEHEVMPSGTIEWGTLRQNFVEGATAMMWHTTGNLTAARNEAGFDFGVALLPAKERRGSPTGGGNFYIFEDASEEERQAALTFIKWMTEPERAAQWSIDTGYMGVSPVAYETEVLQAYTQEFPPAAVARDQLDYGTAELSTYQGGRIRHALNDAIQATLTGSMSAEEALSQAQRQADQALRPYR